MTPSIAEIRSLACAGFGLSIPYDMAAPFDLGLLADSVEMLPLLWLHRDEGWFLNSTALKEMTSLWSLRTRRAHTVMDLSSLTNLREVAINGPALRAALAAPRLQDALVEAPRIDGAWMFSPTLRSVGLDARRIDIAHVATSAPNLESVVIYNAEEVDLAPLAQLVSLRELRMINCRRLKGLGHLSRSESVETLSLDRIRYVEDPLELLNSRAHRVEVMGSPDFSQEFADVVQSRGWHVVPTNRRSAQHARVERVREDLYLVTFDEWGWLQDQLFGALDAPQVTSGILEAVLSDEVSAAWRKDDGWYEFDSEGDAVLANTGSIGGALKMQYVWNRLFADVDRLRASISGRGIG